MKMYALIQIKMSVITLLTYDLVFINEIAYISHPENYDSDKRGASVWHTAKLRHNFSFMPFCFTHAEWLSVQEKDRPQNISYSKE